MTEEEKAINFNQDNLIDFAESDAVSPYIKVIGVGGAGTNAVNHMFREGIKGVDYIICNTDQISLDASPIKKKIKIGKGVLGAGNKPEKAKQAAKESEEEIKQALCNDTRMLFITAGMGGGTGTGASAEIARMAKEIQVDGYDDEILVIGVVTTPFGFEGRKRKQQAEEGIRALREYVDATIVINTDRLKDRANMKMSEAFATLDNILLTAVKGISDIMTSNAYIRVDFEDVKEVMRKQGVALMGAGTGSGEDRVGKALEAAMNSDLLNDNDISGSKNVLYYITCSHDKELTQDELNDMTNYVADKINGDVDAIWGYGYDDRLGDSVAITLIATGFEAKELYWSNGSDSSIKKTTAGTIDAPEQITKPTLETIHTEAKKIEEPMISGISLTSNPINIQPSSRVEPVVITPEPIPTTTPIIDTIEQFQPTLPTIENTAPKTIIGTLTIDDEAPKQESQPEQKPEPIINIINEPVAETPACEEPVAEAIQPQVAVMEEVPFEFDTNIKQEPTRISDVITGNPMQRPSTSDERMRRMEAIRKLLQDPHGKQLVEEQRYNLPYESSPSQDKQKTHSLTMNESGTITYTTNTVLNSSVD